MKVNLAEISENYMQHSSETDWYQKLSRQLKSELDAIGDQEMEINFGDFNVFIPFVTFGGGITSKNLLGLDELILFSAYWRLSSSCKSLVDMGANIGLHSVVASKLGYLVNAYEPDPIHTSLANRMFKRNGCGKSINLMEVAVVGNSGKDEVEFVRVKGNTTSSHVSGAKNPYGELERFNVATVGVNLVLKESCVVKMDVEGSEAELLQSISDENLKNFNLVLEVGSPVNAKQIFEFASKKGLNMFSQKSNWSLVEKEDQIPNSYKEGSLHITSSKKNLWEIT